ncbi:MAG TPA: rhodanese-like domain-containing protein, partial [bacterium]|nr:rhodanese-like domain-containing protein [bacterium]
MGLLDKLFGKKKDDDLDQAEVDAHHAAEVAPPPSESWDVASHSIDVSTLKGRLESGEELMLIDVRELWEFNSGNIPGSINIPLSELGIMVRDLDPSKPYVTVCAMGIRSLDA